MDDQLQWLGPAQPNGVIVRRFFQIQTPREAVPGVLWRPAHANGPRPTVLLGHGGSGEKHDPRNVELALWFAGCAGYAVVAIDAPHHGERVPTPMSPPEYQQRMIAEGPDNVLDRMTADWLATLHALGALAIADMTAVAYIGVSMGTRFGLALAAEMGEELKCAVLGKLGLLVHPDVDPGYHQPERIARDARRTTTPTLFHLQWDDELFPRMGQLALFDLIGSRKKRLSAVPGKHGERPPVAVQAWQDFVVHSLSS